MAKKIDSGKLCIKDVFTKWFRIPEYQRPYVWTTDQVTELLDDVLGASESNRESLYFLGSMVLLKETKTLEDTEYEEFDVLDGQQRIITLLLIIAVIRDIAPETNKKLLNTCEKIIAQHANSYENIPERNRIVFDIRDEVRSFVEKFIAPYKGTLQEHDLASFLQKRGVDISVRNMTNAILIIKKFFQDTPFMDKFMKFLLNQVVMIYVSADDLEDAFNLFIVMNSRGIKLRNSDILKVQNLREVKDVHARTKYAEIWETIEEYFAEDFDNFLSYLRTILVKRKADYNLLKEFEQNIYSKRDFDSASKTSVTMSPLLEKGECTFKFVERYYKCYQDLFEDDNYKLRNSFEFINQLTLMQRGLESDNWIAPLLRFYEKYKTNSLLEFLYLLDSKFSADWIVGLSPATRINNTNAIIKDIETTDDPTNLFSSQVFKFVSQDLLSALSGPLYGRSYCRYVLLKIDLAYHGHTTQFSPPQTLSIEHILPRKPDPESQWMSDYTEQEREKWIDRLGNLIFLSRKKNTAQGNLDFRQKKEKYFKKNIELFSNSLRILQTYGTWTLDDLKKNHKDSLTKLLESYGVKISNDEVEKAVQ